MSTLQLSMVAIVVLGGMASAAQSLMNGTLARTVHDPVLAAMWSFGTGFVMLMLLYTLRSGSSPVTAVLEAPKWALLGGLMGLVMVLAAIAGVPKLGLLTTIAALVLGQVVAALLLDALKVFADAPPISLTRIVAVGLVFSGLVMSRL